MSREPMGRCLVVPKHAHGGRSVSRMRKASNSVNARSITAAAAKNEADDDFGDHLGVRDGGRNTELPRSLRPPLS